MEELWKDKITKEYIGSCHLMKKYVRLDPEVSIPPDVTERYNEALFQYRYLLDTLSLKLPRAKHPYNQDDKSTWKYLNVIISEKKYISAVTNPTWKYENAK